MAETNFYTNEIELDNQEKIEAKKAPSLRERVFLACNFLESQNAKMTRDAVRAITKGSCRDLSRYMREWRESKNSNTTISATSNDGQDVNNSFGDSKNTVSLAMTSAKCAAEIILAHEKSVQYFLENPDKLPEEFKQEIAKAKNETYDIMNKRWKRYAGSVFQEWLYQV